MIKNIFARPWPERDDRSARGAEPSIYGFIWRLTERIDEVRFCFVLPLQSGTHSVNHPVSCDGSICGVVNQDKRTSS